MRRNAPRLKISFSFLAFNALVFLLRDTGIILAFYTVCALHEAGHIAAALATGTKIASVELTGFGIRMETVPDCTAPVRRQLAVLIAGPAVNAAVYLLMRLLRCGGCFPLLNLSAALYNLLPYRCLDGGAVIEVFTSGSRHEYLAGRLILAAEICVSAALLTAALWGVVGALALFAASALLMTSDVCRST
jgi:Zn-dependent protease